MLKILLLVLFVMLLLVSRGYIRCATGSDGGDAMPTTTTPITTTTPATDKPYDLSDIYCWGTLDWGDEPYRLGGSGYVFCWDGYGIGYWNTCWDNPDVGCWDGYDVFCRDGGGEGWQDCYDYYWGGKTWRSTSW